MSEGNHLYVYIKTWKVMRPFLKPLFRENSQHIRGAGQSQANTPPVFEARGGRSRVKSLEENEETDWSCCVSTAL